MKGSIKNKWLVLGLLALAYTLSFVDRYEMNILLGAIKKDLHLTDTGVSLLAGAGFAFFYALMALPMGRLADTGSRVTVISAGVAIWSVMTATCGLAKNFAQLLLARIGVGVGEAALSPSAYSLLTDYFPKRLLATAIGIYSSGIYIGAGLAYILGGFILKHFEGTEIVLPIIGHVFSWQVAFMLFGLPGLLVALLILLIREPGRSTTAEQPSVKQFIQYLKSNGRPFLLLCAGSAVFNIAVYATGVWIPAFLTRVHNIPVETVGYYTGAGIMVLSPVGAIMGGRVADILAGKSGTKGRLSALLIFIALFIPACVVYGFTATANNTFMALIPYALLVSAGVAVTAATVQEIVPVHFRGTASACMLFAQNIVGMSLGPTSVALISDYVFKNEMMIGKALALVSVITLVVAFVIFNYSRQALKQK